MLTRDSRHLKLQAQHGQGYLAYLVHQLFLYLNLMKPNLLKNIEKAFGEELQARVELALRQVQKGMKVDIFSFAEAFHRKYPKQFAKVQDHWDEVFPQIEVVMDIETHIRRPGLATVPGAIPAKEVKEK